MKRIIDAINREKQILAQGEFFTWLSHEDAGDKEKLRFIPCMYSYVMSFRDLLSLIQGEDDDGLQHAVNAYIGEDASHYEWYLQDLEKIPFGSVTPVQLWDRRLLPSRRAIYRMIGYALEHNDVVLRVILVMIFEATGEVFLRHTRQLVTRLGMDQTLGYFGTRHYQDEVSHTIQFDQMSGIVLTGHQYETGIHMISKAFAEYQGLFQSWKDCALIDASSVDLYDGRQLKKAVVH